VNWYRNTYNIVFVTFLLSVLLVFFYSRPFDSPKDRVIAGNGLGYYSYLPAKYIYNDPNYEFIWFNQAYDSNYVQETFSNPEDNFLVKYGNRKINKYSQGLSYIWLPFFILGHFYAKATGYLADGFSLPYQLAIALASLFYLFLGLIYLRKLLEKLFHNNFVSVAVPILLFYGSHLFFYAIQLNSLSHVYSFTFLVLFTFSLVSYFNDNHKRLRNLLLCFLWLTISICIHPLNGIVILLVPAFLPNGFFKERLRFEKFKFRDLIILIVALGAIANQFIIAYTQTGTLTSYTYTGERFYFYRSVFFDALIGYRIGLFVYVPLFFISFFGIPFLPKHQRIILPLFFLGVLYLYSCWWYWPIVKRAMIDFYFIPAIFLGALLNRFSARKNKIISIIIFLSVIFFQFKNFQVNKGILSEFNTYEIFWRNFFKTKKTTLLLVPPSVLKQVVPALKPLNNRIINRKFIV
jgi:hypothetical protein